MQATTADTGPPGGVRGVPRWRAIAAEAGDSRPLMRALLAQTRIELLLTLRRGESVLLTFLIPVVLLAFFAQVDVLPRAAGDARHPVPVPRHHRAGHHVDGHGEPGDRNRVRAVDRRAQAARIDAAQPAAAARRQDPGHGRHRGPADRDPAGRGPAPGVPVRRPVARPGPGRRGAGHRRLCRAGPAHGRLAAGAHHPGRWPTASTCCSCSSAAWSSRSPSCPPACASSPRPCPPAPCPRCSTTASTAGAGVPAHAWIVLAGWAVVAPLAAAALFRWE